MSKIKMKRIYFSIVLTLLCACQTTVSPTPISSITPTPSQTPPPWKIIGSTSTAALDDPVTSQADSQIQNDWANSPHALQNSSSVADPQVVGCNNCHETVGGIIDGSKVAWWNATANQYESIPDINALCQKCHGDIKLTGQQVSGQNPFHKDFECTYCHNPHSTAASCTNSTCHQNIIPTDNMPPSTPTGGHPQIGNPFCGGSSCHPVATAVAIQSSSVHGAAHVIVACEACHAAGDLEAGPKKSHGPWILWLETDQSGNTTKVPFFSHEIQLEVNCQRCHYENNPWGLPLVTGKEFTN